MKPLIERHQEFSLVCDNPKCDFKILYSIEVESRLHEFINASCPKCGENILTYGDYLRFVKVMNTVNFINKYFSWLGLFISDKKKKYNVLVHTHDKIEIENVQPVQNK